MVRKFDTITQTHTHTSWLNQINFDSGVYSNIPYLGSSTSFSSSRKNSYKRKWIIVCNQHFQTDTVTDLSVALSELPIYYQAQVAFILELGNDRFESIW